MHLRASISIVNFKQSNRKGKAVFISRSLWINSYFGYKLIDQIRLQTYNTSKEKEKKQNILSKSSKKFEKQINEIKNKNIRDSLSQLLDIVKND